MSKENPVILDKSTSTTSFSPYVFIDSRRFRFSVQAIKDCKLQVGNRMHFIYFGRSEEDIWTDNEWYFYVDDADTGVPLRNDGKNSLVAQEASIARRFLSRYMQGNKKIASLSFEILKQYRITWHGHMLWKIDISKEYVSPMARHKKK